VHLSDAIWHQATVPTVVNSCLGWARSNHLVTLSSKPQIAIGSTFDSSHELCLDPFSKSHQVGPATFRLFWQRQTGQLFGTIGNNNCFACCNIIIYERYLHFCDIAVWYKRVLFAVGKLLSASIIRYQHYCFLILRRLDDGIIVTIIIVLNFEKTWCFALVLSLLFCFKLYFLVVSVKKFNQWTSTFFLLNAIFLFL
jgi:hypothetical protein